LPTGLPVTASSHQLDLDHPALPRSAAADAAGRLAIGGRSLADLAAEFGTPLFAVDVQELRETARTYVGELRRRHERTEVRFALKAFPCAPVVRVLGNEGLGCEVVSAGELAIALSAGIDPARILLHGNAKAEDDLVAALDAGVGLIVIDSFDDVERLQRLASRPQAVLVRVNPGVAASTHAALDTGSGTSKFGVAARDVPQVIERIRRTDLLQLDGLHVHVGSQLLDLTLFERAAAALAPFGRFATYDLGGGLGVPYAPGDPEPSIAAYAEALVGALHRHLDPAARLIVEPGRSMVARSCVTLYSVVTVKRADRTHVAVDGGMGDNLEVGH
jgi:diaminopimelate decarboxylase